MVDDDRTAAVSEPTRVHFPSALHHKHGLNDWWPMLPVRSAETIDPGAPLLERVYRCQFVGCLEMVRVDANELLGAETTTTA